MLASYQQTNKIILAYFHAIVLQNGKKEMVELSDWDNSSGEERLIVLMKMVNV